MMTIIIGIIRITRDTAGVVHKAGVEGPTAGLGLMDGVGLMVGDGEDIQVIVILG